MKPSLLNILVLWLLCHVLSTEPKLNKTLLKDLGCDVEIRARDLTGDFVIGGIFPAFHKTLTDGNVG